MDRKEQRKLFSQFKKKKENELKLKTIERYGGEVYQMYLDKEITLQEAYNHSKSEQLGIQGYKSRGTKGFIHSTKIKTKKSVSKLPLKLLENRKCYTEFKNFPTFTEEHFDKLINEITPVIYERGYLVKHDDMFDLGGICGGKVRQCIKLVYDNLQLIKDEYNGGIITASGLPSPQSTIVSSVAKYFGLKSVVSIPYYKDGLTGYNRINPSLSQQLGSKIYGCGNPNTSGPEKDARLLSKELGYYQVKFGMNGLHVTNTVANQVVNIPDTVENIVIISGSGLSAIGILKGISKFNKPVKNVYVITLSSYFQQNKKKWYDKLSTDEKFKGNIHEIRSEIPYQKYHKIDGTFDFDLTYESKAWEWMMDNIEPSEKTLFWVVGKKIYDESVIEQIDWYKSSHERELDKDRERKHFSQFKTKESESKLPYERHTLIDDKSINITFHEINQMDYHQFKDFVIRLRKELKRVWVEQGIPPYIGKNHQEIIDDFKSLYSKDVSVLYRDTDDKSYEFIIENNWREGSTCNQFFPSIHKVRVGKSSLYDLITDDKLELRWLRMMVRNLKQDYLYEFSKRVKNKNEVIEKSKEFGLVIQKSDTKDDITFTYEELKELLSDNIIKDYHLKNIESEKDRYDYFEIRYYNKTQKIFNNLIHILRVSFGNTPVNFHPQVSKFLYEHFLPKNKRSVVYDPCSGFGGRLLGSLLSNRDIHYIGTDINTNLFEPINSYDTLGEFVRTHVRKDISYSIDKISSDEMDKSKELKKYMGKIDMVFTSPPYFSKEKYSDDKEQSYNKYPSYQDWITKYLHDTFLIAFNSLKKGGICLVNISDITINSHSLPLELDTIQTLENIGFTYKYQIGMKMQKFMGLKPSNILNRWWDEKSESYKKVEPILVFVK